MFRTDTVLKKERGQALLQVRRFILCFKKELLIRFFAFLYIAIKKFKPGFLV